MTTTTPMQENEIKLGLEKRWRAIWISDIHLGTAGCNAQLLLDFLKAHESDVLYLVGDIFDGWRLKRRWYWPQTHNDVVQKILRKVRKGTHVIFIPGNHDEFLRDYIGVNFGGIQIYQDFVHVTADGKRLLVLHGDEFDGVVRYHKWLAHLGAASYDLMIVINRWFNATRRMLGLPYWSLSAYIKRQVKEAVKFITHFEEAVIAEAALRNADGAVCGHIHSPQMRTINGLLYCNDGDWVETCSALVEDFDGKMYIARYSNNQWLYLNSEQLGSFKAASNTPGITSMTAR